MEITGVMPARSWIRQQIEAWAEYQKRKGLVLTPNHIDSLTGHLYGNWVMMVTMAEVEGIKAKEAK